jgi:hypothetical protein
LVLPNPGLGGSCETIETIFPILFSTHVRA